MKKLCCFFNYNPLYRYPIYHAMDKELDCDFYFGDSVFEPLKQFDPHTLKGYKKSLHAIRIFRSYQWHSGAISLLKGYSDYLITGQFEYLTNWCIILYAKLTGKRVYCWTHGVASPTTRKRQQRLIEKIFFNCMDGILMYNNYRVPYMTEMGIKKEAISVIHNSLNTSLQTSIYKRLMPSAIYTDHFRNEYPTIIYIGRIQKRKKVDMLIEAVSMLHHDHYPINLVLVGDIMEGVTIKSQIMEKGLDPFVWFYGPCYEEEKNAELLYNAAACVCPAEVGLTAIHALSYGTPVISNNDFETQMPEFEAIQEGVTGSFYLTDDIKSLAHEIHRWTNVTPKERDAIRENSRKEIVASWSVSYQIEVLKRTFSTHILEKDKMTLS
jgi:glycosyltransferase involved in cell wall biosynthesis